MLGTLKIKKALQSLNSSTIHEDRADSDDFWLQSTQLLWGHAENEVYLF